VTIDNRWYDDLGDDWWDESGRIGPLHRLNPARWEYFKRVAGTLSGLRVLDVGCGGGLLAEQFARADAQVTGVDLSRSSLAAARRHAQTSRLAINYVNATGERLPFTDAAFAVIVSADFLEHVSDLDGVVGECARVLEPGGLFLYDTINRTLRSRLIAVWLFERVLKIIPRHTHEHRLFIKPTELHAAMARHGIANRETRGLGPQGNQLAALVGYITKRRFPKIGATDDTAVSYIGYGVKIN
jgi:2-polyprenyl-6-hydroxyphenyl methylase/3-demethylubiquinone-9 3-methyltransferase